MEVNIQHSKTNGNGNGHLPTKKSHPVTDGSNREVHHSIFDPMKYMLKLPKHKKVSLGNGQVRFEKTEADYLPVAARIAWFRKDHPYWSIIKEVEGRVDVPRSQTRTVLCFRDRRRTRPPSCDSLQQSDSRWMPYILPCQAPALWRMRLPFQILFGAPCSRSFPRSECSR